MTESERKYFIRLGNQLVEVSREVYTAYYQMDRQERYQIERDYKHGLLYYDSWDTEESNGEDYIKDITQDTEESAIRSIINLYIAKYIAENDTRRILQYLLLGKTEREIAMLLGVSKSSVNRAKMKMIKALKEYFG